MYKWTTPTFTYELEEDINLEEATDVYVAFSLSPNGKRTFLVKNDLEVEGNTVKVYLTQCESGSFPVGRVYMMINWTYIDGKRACTVPIAMSVHGNMIERLL